MRLTARPYQDTLICEAAGRYRTVRRVLIVLPTGGGKTIIFSLIAERAAAKGKRVVIVAHRQEIVDQISRALDGLGVRHGRIQPGHRMTDDHLQVSMIQTLARRLDAVPEPQLLVIDESHHAVTGSYKLITDAWPNTRILGVTATPQRMDGKGLGEAFDEMVVGPSMRELIDAGFLADFSYLAPPQRVDLSSIETRMGDYAIDQLAAVMDRSVITGDAVAHYRTHLAGRPAIAFCVTVAHAEHVARQFAAAGFRAESVDGTMDRSTRHNRLAAIGSGGLDVLTSCELISEGVDVPVVSGAILLRPTKSLSMQLQQVGRALRPKPDGSRAVILDHVGNVHRHGLPDAPRAWTLEGRKKREGAAPTTQCGVCFRVFALKSGWKADQECQSGCPDDCVLTAAAAERKEIETQDGELVAVTPSPDWTLGISIAAAKGDDFKRLLRLANTPDRLREVATVRGYKAAWVHQILELRQLRALRPARDEVPFSIPAARPVFAPRVPARRASIDELLDEALSA